MTDKWITEGQAAEARNLLEAHRKQQAKQHLEQDAAARARLDD